MKVLFEKSKRKNYYITETGEVLSFNNSKKNYTKKKATLNKQRGYLYVRTPKGNLAVHRLVASAFLKNKENKKTVNHKNCIKTDNRLENLEWMTHRENMKHAEGNNLIKKLKKNEGNIKYTNKQCKEVIDLVRSGLSYRKAGSKFNMPYSTVAHLMRGSRRDI
jgi:hypothetical protein